MAKEKSQTSNLTIDTRIDLNEWCVEYYCLVEGNPHFCAENAIMRYKFDRAFWVYFTLAHNFSLGPKPTKDIQHRILSYTRDNCENSTIVADLRIVYDEFDHSKYGRFNHRYTFRESHKPFKPILPQPEMYELLLSPRTGIERSDNSSKEYLSVTQIWSVVMNIWEYVVFREDYVRFSKFDLIMLWEDMIDIADYFLGTAKQFGEFNDDRPKDEDPFYLLNLMFNFFHDQSGKKEHEIIIDSALKKLTYDTFTNLTDEMIRRKIIIKCQECGFFAIYRHAKKFCSLAVDGQDCSKRHFSKLDYVKHRQKRLETRKAWIRKTRKEIPGY